MKFLTIFVILIAFFSVIDSLPIGNNQIQPIDQGESWYNNAWNSVISFGKKVKEFSKRKIESFNRPRTSTRHICIWKICSKPLKGSMRTSIPKKNSIRYHNQKYTNLGEYVLSQRN